VYQRAFSLFRETTFPVLSRRENSSKALITNAFPPSKPALWRRNRSISL
jgi:hypothetical protein